MEGKVVAGTISRKMAVMVDKLVTRGIYKDTADVVREGIRNVVLNHQKILGDRK